jgi:hypothetical protein
MNRDELADWIDERDVSVFPFTRHEFADALLPLIERKCRTAVVTELREQAGGLELVANIRAREDRAEAAAAWGWASVTLNRRADEIEGEGVAVEATEQVDAPVDFTDGTWLFRGTTRVGTVAPNGMTTLWRESPDELVAYWGIEAIKTVGSPVRVRVVTDTRIEKVDE